MADMNFAGANRGVINAMRVKYSEMGDSWQSRAGASRHRIRAEGGRGLRKVWESSYNENVTFANEFFSDSAKLTKLEVRDGVPLGSHPAFVHQMAEVGRRANEGRPTFGISGTEMQT